MFKEKEKSIKEVEEWIEFAKEDGVITKLPEFQKLINDVIGVRSLYEAVQGNYVNAFKNFFKPIGFCYKIKIIAAAVLPFRLVNFLKNMSH